MRFQCASERAAAASSIFILIRQYNIYRESCSTVGERLLETAKPNRHANTKRSLDKDEVTGSNPVKKFFRLCKGNLRPKHRAEI